MARVSRRPSEGFAEGSRVAEVFNWKPTKYKHDNPDYGRLGNAEDFEVVSRSPSPQPAISAISVNRTIPATRPAPDDDVEQAPKRKRFDSQTLGRIQANIQSLRSSTPRRKSSSTSRRRSSSGSSAAKSVAENGGDHTESGVRLDNGRTTPPVDSGDASPSEPAGATRRKPTPKGPSKSRLSAMLMKTTRPVPVAEKPVSPPLSPQSPAQEATEKPVEDSTEEHTFESAEEPSRESAEEFSAQQPEGPEVYRLSSGKYAGMTVNEFMKVILAGYKKEVAACDSIQMVMQGYDAMKEDMKEEVEKIVCQDVPDFESELNHIKNSRLPKSTDEITSVFGGWWFKAVPWWHKRWLSYELSQGRKMDGNWAPLYQAFEYWDPELLPGCRWKAMQNSKHQQPPPNAPTGPKALQRDAVNRSAFSLDPQDFQFPNSSPYSFKRIDQLEEQEQKKVVKQWRSGALRKMLNSKDFSDCEGALRYWGLID
ncbi:hypothetical protein Alg130_11302 [Pyrenophora tritici-repentis]|nr:hypothetical protein Alg130_11302 [Pyrenophora tritici-repentis]KAI0604441.1 hypothetical protein TUN205_11311 [Pyrenophora tritici-repentis]